MIFDRLQFAYAFARFILRRAAWRVGSALGVPAPSLPGYVLLRSFVVAWATSPPQSRIALAPCAAVGRLGETFICAGGIRAGFRLCWTDELGATARSLFATKTCPDPTLDEISGSVIQLAGFSVPLKPEFRQ